jgi:hypothetical protein
MIQIASILQKMQLMEKAQSSSPLVSGTMHWMPHFQVRLSLQSMNSSNESMAESIKIVQRKRLRHGSLRRMCLTVSLTIGR